MKQKDLLCIVYLYTSSCDILLAMKLKDHLDGIFGPIKLHYHRYNYFFIEVHVASQNDVSGVSILPMIVYLSDFGNIPKM